MQKFNYKLNGFFQSRVDYSQLVPSFMYEVNPGESLSGLINQKILSQPTTSASLNDVYYDHYLFYVPYRLVWKDWVNFISERVTGGSGTNPDVPDEIPYFTNPTEPTVQPTWQRFFVKQRLYGQADDFRINALPYWAYILIYNTYFRTQDLPTALYPASGTNPTAVIFNVQSPGSDFHVKTLLTSPSESGPIDTTNVDTLRHSLASDKFAKIRDYYGDKYTDYLKALGVQTSWSILENPELLGKFNKSLSYTLVSNTTDDPSATIEPLGQKGGYYSAQITNKIPRKFFAEHGIVIGLQTCRVNVPINGASHPAWSKSTREDYWSPELDSTAAYDYPGSLFQANAAAGIQQREYRSLPFMDYKYGFNLTDKPGASTPEFDAYTYTRGVPAGDASITSVRDRYLNQSTDMDSFDADSEGSLSDYFLGVQTQTRLTRVSPISRFQKPLY